MHPRAPVIRSLIPRFRGVYPSVAQKQDSPTPLKRNPDAALGQNTMISTMDAVAAGAAVAVANPLAATCVAAAVDGLAVVAAPVLVTTPVLAAVGFTSGAVAKFSAAAAFQSTVGNVVGGSAFATLTSAGAGGYGVPIVAGMAQGAGAATAAVGAVAARVFWGSKS